MKKLFFKFLLLVAGFALLASGNGCRKKEIEPAGHFKGQENFEFSKNGLNVAYAGFLADHSLHINFIVSDKSGADLLNEDFAADVSQPGYAENIVKLITERAADLSLRMDRSALKSLSSVMDLMILEVIAPMKIPVIRKIETQGLFMARSLVKAALRKSLKRSYELNNYRGKQTISRYDTSNVLYDTNTLYEGYTNGMSSFQFNEDIYINTASFVDYMNNDPEASSNGDYVFREVLASKADFITLQELLTGIDAFKDSHPNEGSEAATLEAGKGSAHVNKLAAWWPSGHAHGCCGNYSGTCYFWHPVCYVHDILCSDCTPGWFCFSGCKPD